MSPAITINPAVALTFERGIAILSVDLPPVNALSEQVREGLVTGLGVAIDDADVVAVVLLCAGRTFFAGADIGEFGKPLAGPPLSKSPP